MNQEFVPQEEAPAENCGAEPEQAPAQRMPCDSCPAELNLENLPPEAKKSLEALSARQPEEAGTEASREKEELSAGEARRLCASERDRGHEFAVALHTHNYLSSYIQLADTKTGLLVALCGGLLAILFSTQRHELLAPPEIFTPIGMCTAAGFFFLLLAMWDALAAVWPRLSCEPTAGLVFWKQILAHNTSQAYVSSFLSAGQDRLLAEVARHNFELAGVADRKYWRLRWSFACGVIGAIASVASLVLA